MLLLSPLMRILLESYKSYRKGGAYFLSIGLINMCIEFLLEICEIEGNHCLGD